MAEVRSGSFNTTGYSDAYSPDYYVFSWSLSSQSIVDNTSTITWSVVAAGGSTSGYYNTVRERYVTVNGVTQSASDAQVTYNGTKPFSGTTVIKHDTNGKGSFTASCGGAFEIGGSYNSTGSGSWTLPTIARSTTPTFSATSIEMGKAVTITLTPADSTFKHKLRYDFGSITGSASGFSIGAEFTAQGNTTVTFTPPTSLGNEIPNAMSGAGKITCYTYTSSGTHVGTTSVNVTLNVPSYTPTITDITLTGSNLLSSTYVQGKSTVTVNATVGTSYGATTKSISTVIDGKTYSGLPFTTSVLSNGGKTAQITFVDSRGKSVTVTSSAITVYEYTLPNITDFTLARQTDGTTVIATVKGSIASINSKNAKTIKVTLNGVTNTITSSSYTITTTTPFTNVPTDSTLTGKVVFYDSYYTQEKNNGISREATLPTVAVTMDFYKDGNGIAMGKVAEKGDLLDVAWRIKNSSVQSLIGGLGTSITSNANINTVNFINPGNYVCPSNAIAQTVTNSPTKYAFKMCVHNVTNDYADASAGQWVYIVREITNYQGERWIQNVNKDSGSWVFSPWYLMINSSNIKDYIIEQGTYSDGWEYCKWANGRIELWADKSITFPDPTNMGNYLWSLDWRAYVR